MRLQSNTSSRKYVISDAANVANGILVHLHTTHEYIYTGIYCNLHIIQNNYV